MSKILESIADADMLAREAGDRYAIQQVRETATAARAEHAEIVERLRDAAHALRYEDKILCAWLTELLSRIAPERGA